MLLNFWLFGINLNAQHVNGMTHFDCFFYVISDNSSDELCRYNS